MKTKREKKRAGKKAMFLLYKLVRKGFSYLSGKCDFSNFFGFIPAFKSKIMVGLM